MRNNLVDIVKNTHGLGVIELVKIVGSADETLVEALSEDRSVIVKAKFNNRFLNLLAHLVCQT